MAVAHVMPDGVRLAPPEEPAQRQLSLLLVEDDDGDALLLEEWLLDARLAASLTRSPTLGDALSRMPGAWDCVLLDMNLPDGRGLDCLNRVLAASPDVPIIVVTGLHDEATGVAAVTAGAQDYLVKEHLDGHVLSRAIRYALERKRAERTVQQLQASELRAAENSRLERALLPRPMVRDPRVRIDVRYQPGRQRALLGGDFYDVVEAPDGALRVVIGDVSGHGPNEAAVGSSLRISWRVLVLSGATDAEVIELLDRLLVAERLSDATYATLCLMTVSADRTWVDVICAGHPPPLLLGAASAPLRLVNQLPIGLLPDVERDEPQRIALGPDTELLLYTDGVIDGHTGVGTERLEVSGLVALAESLRARQASPLADAVVAEVSAADAGRLADDMAVVHLRWTTA